MRCSKRKAIRSDAKTLLLRAWLLVNSLSQPSHRGRTTVCGGPF
jgi:hypothetical protein